MLMCVVGGWYTVTVQFWKSIRQPSPEAEIWWLWVWRGWRRGAGGNSPHALAQTRAGGGGGGVFHLCFSSVWNRLHLAVCVCGGSIAGSWVLGYRQPTLWSSRRAPSLGPACCARHFGCISLLPRRTLRRDNSLIPLSQRRKPLLSKQIFWQTIWRAVEIVPLCLEVEGAMQRSPETGSSLEPHEDLPPISF